MSSRVGRKSKVEETGLGTKIIEKYRGGDSYADLVRYINDMGYNKVNYDNVRNYVTAHVDDAVATIVDGEVVLSDNVADWAGLADSKFRDAFTTLNNRADDIYSMAVETQDLSTALKAIEQLRKNIQTFSRELGETVIGVVNIEKQYNTAMIGNMRGMVSNLEKGIFEEVDKRLPKEYADEVKKIVYELIERKGVI